MNPAAPIPASSGAKPSAAAAQMPLPPLQLERRLAGDAFDITAVDSAGAGVMGAKKLGIVFRADRLRLDLKWKAAPHGGDGWNNSPRREIGVYEIQKFFLDPDEYIVPPIVARGVEFDVYRPVDEKPSANLDGVSCVYGTLAVWLTNAERPKQVWDKESIASDRRYAFHFGNLNLLHYLTDHRDSRGSNFLMAKEPDEPRIFSIDNGIAFGGTLFNFFSWHYNRIRVASLPHVSIERLRRVRRDDLERLGVLTELRCDAQGVLRRVVPGSNLDPTKGNRVGYGIIQIGLTSAEIAAIARRIAKLLRHVDRGKLGTF